MPSISIIMPVYNSEKYLKAAIESIINQTFTDWELIIIDDGSIDRSGKICDEYAQKDSRIIVIHQENQGMCAARNYGMENAKGKYIAFMDNDDECEPELLSRSYAAAVKFQADVVKFGRCSEIVNSDGSVIKKDTRNLDFNIYTKERVFENFFYLRGLGVFSPIWDGIYCSEIIKKNKLLFDTSLRYGEEDTIFCLSLLPHITTFVTIPGVYYKHYIWEGHSASSKFDKRALDKYMVSADAMKKTLESQKLWNKNPVLQNLCIIGQYVLPVLEKLHHENCPYSYKEKRDVLNNLKTSPSTSTVFSLRIFIQMIRKDIKKSTVFLIYNLRWYRLLLMIYKFYFNVKSIF